MKKYLGGSRLLLQHIAEDAARDSRSVDLAGELDACLLCRGDAERYERAAARWVARVALGKGLRLQEVELLAAGLRGLAGPQQAESCAALHAFVSARGWTDIARRLSSQRD
ncbi:MAG: hypothetical protein ACXVYV_01715 [Gaiellales bacterium]